MNAPVYEVRVWFPGEKVAQIYDDVSDFWQTADMFRFVDPATGRNVVLSGIPFAMLEQPRKP
jgi:hypothetical protein